MFGRVSKWAFSYPAGGRISEYKSQREQFGFVC